VPDSGARQRLVAIEGLTPPTPPEQPVQTWTPLAAVWMARRDLATRERFVVGQTAAALETEWTMPYLATMDPETVDVPATRRLVYQRRQYDITGAVREDLSAGGAIRLYTVAASAIPPEVTRTW
jgi:head-tail adaptor